MDRFYKMSLRYDEASEQNIMNKRDELFTSLKDLITRYESETGEICRIWCQLKQGYTQEIYPHSHE